MMLFNTVKPGDVTNVQCLALNAKTRPAYEKAYDLLLAEMNRQTPSDVGDRYYQPLYGKNIKKRVGSKKKDKKADLFCWLKFRGYLGPQACNGFEDDKTHVVRFWQVGEDIVAAPTTPNERERTMRYVGIMGFEYVWAPSKIKKVKHTHPATKAVTIEDRVLDWALTRVFW